MAKKNNGDRSLVITKQYFETFTQITTANIKDYYYNKSLFIIAIVVKNSVNIVNSFTTDLFNISKTEAEYSTRPIHVKGLTYRYAYYWDSNVYSINVSVKGDLESIDDYNVYTSDIKTIIRNEIKTRRLYGKKLWRKSFS